MWVVALFVVWVLSEPESVRRIRYVVTDSIHLNAESEIEDDLLLEKLDSAVSELLDGLA